MPKPESVKADARAIRPAEQAEAEPSRGGAGREGAARIVRVAAPDGMDLYGWARPDSDAGGFEEQIRTAFGNLGRELGEHGASPRHVITEKVFVSELAASLPCLELSRQEFYRPAGRGPGAPRPATTTVLQPPAAPGRRCEIQVQAFVPGDPAGACAQAIGSMPEGSSGLRLKRGGVSFIHLANLTAGRPGDGLDFAGQAATLFRLGEDLLEREGWTFREVVRTWLYLPEMERDYDALNRARRDFFDRLELREYPASTGIQGRVPPPGRDCGLDLLALEGDSPLAVQTIHSPTMNEAPDYGALFSRGVRIDLAGRTVIHLSGTASIDPSGRVAAVGDPAGQARVMLNNVERLLAGQGAGLPNLVSAVTYLKRAADLPVFESAYRERGFPDWIPHTFCVADVCRPAWLCEIEAVAVLPRS